MKRSRFGENRIIAILNSAKLPRKVLPENTKRAAARCSRRWRVPYRRRVTNGCMNDVQSSSPGFSLIRSWKSDLKAGPRKQPHTANRICERLLEEPPYHMRLGFVE